MRLGDLAPQIN